MDYDVQFLQTVANGRTTARRPSGWPGDLPKSRAGTLTLRSSNAASISVSYADNHFGSSLIDF